MNTPRSDLVFYSRCKPQGCDALKIALENKVVFVGFPLWRTDVPYDPRSLSLCLVHPDADWDEWDRCRRAVEPNPQYMKNRNLVREVGPGAIALIPRPEFGLVYAAIVESKFEVVSSPPWYDAYMRLRGETVDDGCHAGDIAQVCRVGDFVEIPVPDVPGWLRGSLFGRSTYARVHGNPAGGLDPHAEMQRLIRDERRGKVEWTTEAGEIALRLSRNMAPANFEHLVVSLLQLERTGERWFQVGGSGDGGADGLGYDEHGNLVGILQCKLTFHGNIAELSALSPHVRRECISYFASLHHPATLQAGEGVRLLNRSELVRLVHKHEARLPEAIAMRIGHSA